MQIPPRLGILAKWPTPGRVKTRLSPPLAPADAARLYTAFVADLLHNLAPVAPEHTLFLDRIEGPVSRLGWPEWPVHPQPPGDLGARLHAAWRHLAATDPPSPVVLVGADHPDLPPSRITAAFELLETRDLVLGPSLDGGYCLIGLRVDRPGLFERMPWSTPHLLDRTLDAARGLSIGALEPWYDIDRPADLELLRRRLRLERAAGRLPCPRTWSLLEALMPATE